MRPAWVYSMSSRTARLNIEKPCLETKKKTMMEPARVWEVIGSIPGTWVTRRKGAGIKKDGQKRQGELVLTACTTHHFPSVS